MAVSESHFNIVFTIEPRPGGGFVARSSNPAVTLEGATKEELQSKIRAKMIELAGPEVAAAFAALDKNPADDNSTSFFVTKRSSVITHKSESTFGNAPNGTLLEREAFSSSSGPPFLVKLLFAAGVLLMVLWLALRSR